MSIKYFNNCITLSEKAPKTLAIIKKYNNTPCKNPHKIKIKAGCVSNETITSRHQLKITLVRKRTMSV